jgi:hypothetical protein
MTLRAGADCRATLGGSELEKGAVSEHRALRPASP